ncbi:MAG TPA: PAS domain-containing protein [Candidatus Binatia bacterium]|nr:PAS domain-containing protein [Candidatus Binatia bacterium]
MRQVDLLLRLIRGETTLAEACNAHDLQPSVIEGWLEPLVIASPESSLQTIVDTLPTLVWYADADGAAEFFNQRWRDYAGLSGEEARGAGWTVALHPDDIARVQDQWSAIVASAQPGELEARLRHRDGTYRWFLFRAVPSFDAQGAVLKWYGTNIDIEDRKRAEEGLRASERRSRMVVDSLPGSVCTMGPSGELELVNRRVLDYFGLTIEELREWSTVVHPDDRPRVAEAWAHSVRTGDPYDIEQRLRGADGTYRWFLTRGLPERDADGRIVRWYVLITDVEDRRRAEETLRESERELRLLVDSFPGMVAVASADGRHEYANKRVMDYVRKSLQEVAGFGWIDDVHPDDRDMVRAEWLRCIANRRPMDVQHRWRRFDGVYRWVHSRTEPLLDEHGTVLRWYGLLTDIDDQRQTEAALRKSQAELAHVTRVTTMGELAASIAHEVNQPLAAIVNNANACLTLLPEGAPPLDDVREALGEIVEDADRASTVIARVRQLAKKAPFESGPLDVQDVVADVLALARHESTTRHVIIRTELPDDLPRITGDRVQLQQVLLNLVVNGMDAMSTVEESRRVLTIRGHRETNREVWLAVADAGVGFAPTAIDRLFDAFFTTKPMGLGMGLAISRSIVAAHGGQLWAESNRGPGVTFMLSLPTTGDIAP